MTDSRPTADQLLSSIEAEERSRARGRLKIFLGMCPGVGKTYAMLEAARRERDAGRDVVIGYVETHGRKETDALTDGLEHVPRCPVKHRGVALSEMNLDSVLARKPQLALVDELAHTNAPGSRHPKRYQDVQELLDEGIDVFTTLNVQHVASRAEVVGDITGTRVHETVPDSILDTAEFELVDLPPDDLLKRLSEGKVYVTDRAEAAARNFFRKGNLFGLRELAFRVAAEHVAQDVRDHLRIQQQAGTWRTGQRLLVAISPSPLSESMARWTRRLAHNLQAPWLGLYVETGKPLSDEAQSRLQKNLSLARELGAEVLTTTDTDVVAALLRTARQQNVTQIVVGKPAGFRIVDLFRGGSILSRLIRDSGNIDVHCVRADGEDAARPPRWDPGQHQFHVREYGVAAAVTACVTAANLGLQPWIGSAPLSLVYLLSVVALGLNVGRGASLLGAGLTALAWNFFFTEPHYTFRITSAGDSIMFATYLVIALAMGHLTAKLKAQERGEREREERATALYLLTRELAEAKDFAELLATAIRHLGTVFDADVSILLPDAALPKDLVCYPFGTLAMSEKELSVATWAFQHSRPAGHETDTLPAAEGLYLPLLGSKGCIGVIGLRLRGSALILTRRNLLESFIYQIALVLDRQRLREAEVQATLIAESERLGKTLLNSVSHELRTPLAAISTAVTGLRDAGHLTEAQRTLAGELEEAAARLNRVVRNLLDLSRLEAGHVLPRYDWHDLRDIIQNAVRQLGNQLKDHPLSIEVDRAIPPVKLDFALTEQVLINLIGNAAIHTPPGTPITIRARFESGLLLIEVADTGPGIQPNDLNRVFDRFYRSGASAPGGTGIGLSLVKGFVEAQGGTIAARNREEGRGAVFTIRLPQAKLPPLPEERP